MGRSSQFTLVNAVVAVAAVSLAVLMAFVILGRPRAFGGLSPASGPSAATRAATTQAVTTTQPASGVIARRRRAQCASNLNAIGKGVILYMVESDDRFPLLHTDGDLMEGISTASDMGDVRDLNHNAMQSVWLMIQTGSLDEKHFACPNDAAYKSRKAIEPGKSLKKYGWNSPANYSYGIHKPYGQGHKSALTMLLPGSFPIFADKNYQSGGRPGPVEYVSAKRFTRPGNHPAGFNYLTYGSSVSKRRYLHGTIGRFSGCGVNGDDIYVAKDAGATKPGTTDPAAMPDLDTDTFILPWRPPQPAR